jgi:hypothetical protein
MTCSRTFAYLPSAVVDDEWGIVIGWIIHPTITNPDEDKLLFITLAR